MMKKIKYAGMVDVSDKAVTVRTAVAMARIVLGRSAFVILKTKGSPKGNVFETARIAGIMAAKRVAEVIPLCHSLELDKVNVTFRLDAKTSAARIVAEIRSHGRTGVEMEALYAASVAALTIYDMMKWADQRMKIMDVQLLKKTGGRSGDFQR